MKLIVKFVFLFILSFFLVGKANSQDTTKSTTLNKASIIPNVGGLFIAPSIGFTFPIKAFGQNSAQGLTYGVKLEFASSKIYPFVIGAFYEYTSFPGDDGFKNQHFLNSFTTKVSSLGGGIDIILSKYIKTDFTIPIIGLEAKMMNITREILPDTTNLGLAASESILGYGGSLGFTVFIFDINVGYTHAKDFSSIYAKMRFHFPIIKF